MWRAAELLPHRRGTKLEQVVCPHAQDLGMVPRCKRCRVGSSSRATGTEIILGSVRVLELCTVESNLLIYVQ